MDPSNKNSPNIERNELGIIPKENIGNIKAAYWNTKCVIALNNMIDFNNFKRYNERYKF